MPNININIPDGTTRAALDALAFFQMGQREPVTIEIEDDQIKVYLGSAYLTYPFDATEPTDHEVWYFGYGDGVSASLRLVEEDQEMEELTL